MPSTIIIFICFATHSLADGSTASNSVASITPTKIDLLDSNRLPPAPTTTSSALFDEDSELAKISATCFSSSNFEALAGYVVRRALARILANNLIRESVATIGLTELRATLNLGPLPPWQHFNYTDPSESDLASAPTIQAYYDLKEPRSFFRSLDNEYLYEHNLNASIPYLDERFPSIRTIFRRRFEEIHRSGERVLDRKIIDRMTDAFVEIDERVSKALLRMKTYECWDD